MKDKEREIMDWMDKKGCYMDRHDAINAAYHFGRNTEKTYWISRIKKLKKTIEFLKTNTFKRNKNERK